MQMKEPDENFPVKQQAAGKVLIWWNAKFHSNNLIGKFHWKNFA